MMSTLAELKAALADVNEQIVTLTVKKEEIETQVKELEVRKLTKP
jgi:predicted  nucleic acid-binding Zn-ribbon protein